MLFAGALCVCAADPLALVMLDALIEVSGMTVSMLTLNVALSAATGFPFLSVTAPAASEMV